MACRIYRPCYCSFGGGTAEVKGKLHGAACLLSPNYVITARHNVLHARRTYSWPVTSTHRGLFKCVLVKDWQEEDIVILRLTDKIVDHDGQAPTQWPIVGHGISLAQGMTVGYMTRFHKASTGGEIRVFNYFTPAAVSFFAREDAANPRWVLSGGFTESGFSGSPVFDPAGNLLAVSTNALLMSSVVEGCPPVPFVLPQVSQLPTIEQQILSLILADRTSNR